MAFRHPHPFRPPGFEFLGEASPRSRTLRAKLIEQLEADLASDPALTLGDLVEALQAATVWFNEDRDEVA